MAEEVILRISAEDNTAPGINSAVARAQAAAQAATRSTGSGLPVDYDKQQNDLRARNRQRDAADDADFRRRWQERVRLQKDQAEKDSKERQENYRRQQGTVEQAKGTTDLFGNSTEKATRSVGGMRSQVLGLAAEFVTAATAVEFARRSMLAWGEDDQKIRRMQVQTNRPRGEMEKLMPELRDLSVKTANVYNDMFAGMRKIQSETSLMPDKIMKFFPTIAQGAKAAGTSVLDMSSLYSTLMENLKVKPEDTGNVMDILVKSGTELGLNIQELIAQAPGLTAAFKARGAEGVDGVKQMLAWLIAVKGEFNNTGQAAGLLTQSLNDMATPEFADRLGMNQEALVNYFDAAQKAGKNVLQMKVELAKHAVDNRGGNLELMFGRLQAPFMRALIDNLGLMPGHLDKIGDAAGRAAKGAKIMSEGMDSDITNAITRIQGLAVAIGHLMDTFGASRAMKEFGGDLKAISLAITDIIRWIKVLQDMGPDPNSFGGKLLNNPIGTAAETGFNPMNWFRRMADGEKSKEDKTPLHIPRSITRQTERASEGWSSEGDNDLRGSAGSDTLDDRNILQEERAQRSALVNIERYLHDIHANQGLSGGTGGGGAAGGSGGGSAAGGGGGLGGAPMGRAAGAAAGGAASAGGESAAAAVPTVGGTGTPGTYRPQYKLTDRDMDPRLINTIANEAQNNKQSIDAVINNMMNRVGTKGYGPSKDLLDVSQAKGQYEAAWKFPHRHASAKHAALVKERMAAIASGSEPDITGGSNEFRASWYTGPWGQKHRNAPVIGGNRFARNPNVRQGPFAPYAEPRIADVPTAKTRQTERASEDPSAMDDARSILGQQSTLNQLEQIRAARAELAAPITISTRMDAVEPSFRRASTRYESNLAMRNARQDGMFDTGAA